MKWEDEMGKIYEMYMDMLVDDAYCRIMLSYTMDNPMVFFMHLPSDLDELHVHDNVWVVGRELLALCVIDGKKSGEGDIILERRGHIVTLTLFDREDSDKEVIVAQTKDLERFLNLTYIMCSRSEETNLEMHRMEKQLEGWLK